MSYFNIIAQSSESTVVTEYKPQAKHALSGIDTIFLSERERYPKCELGNMAEQKKLLKKGGRAACPPCL